MKGFIIFKSNLKKAMGIVGIVGVLFICSFIVADSATWNEYSDAGWVSSTGEDTARGIAHELNRCYEDGKVTFTFSCEGEGVCYEINGENLTINHVPGPVTGNCPMIQIQEQ